MKPVTLWYRVYENATKYNHLEDGHNTSGKPTPKQPCHERMWRKGVWISELAHINDNYMVIHDEGNRILGAEFDDDDDKPEN